MKVLLAENRADVRRACAERVVRWGYEVQECDSEAAASHYLRTQGGEVDIALLDMNMETSESGLNLIRLIGELRLLIPSVVLTGYADVLNAAKCMEAGAVNYIPKENVTELLKPALERAGDDRRRRLNDHMRGLRDRLESALARWFLRATWDRFQAYIDAKGNALQQVRAAVDTLYRLHRDFLGPDRLFKLPDAEAPVTTTVEDLLKGIPLVVKVERPPKDVLCRKLRSYASGFPDPTPLIAYMTGGGPSGILLRCGISGVYLIFEFRCLGFQLAQADLQRIDGLLFGAEPKDEREARVLGFALQLTGLAAIARAAQDGSDTVVRILMPLS